MVLLTVCLSLLLPALVLSRKGPKSSPFPWVRTSPGEVANISVCGRKITFSVMTHRDAAIHLQYPQKANILLDAGDHKSLMTLYNAKLYMPNYPSLALQAVAKTENLLDPSRQRYLELQFEGKRISVADKMSGLVLLSLPLAKDIKEKQVHSIQVTALRDALW